MPTWAWLVSIAAVALVLLALLAIRNYPDDNSF